MKPATMYLHARHDDLLGAFTGNRKAVTLNGVKTVLLQVQEPGRACNRHWWRIENCEAFPGAGWHWNAAGFVVFDQPTAATRAPAVTKAKAREDAVSAFWRAFKAFERVPSFHNFAALRAACTPFAPYSDRRCQNDGYRKTRQNLRLELLGVAEQVAARKRRAPVATLLALAQQLRDEGHAVREAKRKVTRSCEWAMI